VSCLDADIVNYVVSDIESSHDSVVLVAPNNPSGRKFSKDDFKRAIEASNRARATLIVDFAFRLFDPEMRWDQYALLESEGASYLAIEDLGKIWPTQDLKVGLLTASSDLFDATDSVHDDFLLNVSPFTLGLLTQFCVAEEAQAILDQIRMVPLGNRRLLMDALTAFGVQDLTAIDSLSVAWLRLPDGFPDGVAFCQLAGDVGVHILPGSMFFFDSPDKGRRLIRVALMRDPAIVADGVSRLRTLCEVLKSKI
jgi:aspartate/methionine/tyrosine aminotransferase